MTKEEYFKEWLPLIPMNKVNAIMHRLRGKSLCPEYKDIFKAFNVCPYDKLRIVILGQEPYARKELCTGLAFANPNNVNPCPVLNAVKRMFPDNVSNDFEYLSSQGLLWLNAALTCEEGNPNSHLELWKPFTEQVLKEIGKRNTGIIYLLIGDWAAQFESVIDRKRNYVDVLKYPDFYIKAGLLMPPLFRIYNKILNDMHGESIIYGKQENKEC